MCLGDSYRWLEERVKFSGCGSGSDLGLKSSQTPVLLMQKDSTQAMAPALLWHLTQLWTAVTQGTCARMYLKHLSAL
eukprot:2458521-Amphidinium_carterae.2